jgi:hypothetical protein
MNATGARHLAGERRAARCDYRSVNHYQAK